MQPIKKDNPFTKKDESKQNRISIWLSKHVTERKVEIFAVLVAAIAGLWAAYISQKSLAASREALEIAKEERLASDFKDQYILEQARLQTEASNRSASALDSQFQAAKKTVELYGKNVKLSQKTAEAQLNLVRVSQNQFDLINNPVLQLTVQIEETDLIQIQDNLWPTKLTCFLKNLGKHFARIKSGRIEHSIIQCPSGEDYPFVRYGPPNIFNYYLGNEPLVKIIQTPFDGAGEDIKMKLINRMSCYYIRCVIFYENILTKEEFVYSYTGLFSFGGIYTIESENMPVRAYDTYFENAVKMSNSIFQEQD